MKTAVYTFRYRNNKLNLPEQTENDKSINYTPWYTYPKLFLTVDEAQSAMESVHPEWKVDDYSVMLVAFFVEEEFLND